MQKVGVEAVVEGLFSYMSDMDKVQGKIDQLGGSGTILGSIFESVTGFIGEFGREVLNVAEVALGVMLRDALEGIISAIGELISKIIEAGNEFQTLTLRLQGMNLNDLTQSGTDFNTAMDESIKLTKEQLSWLQKLAAATPYDNTDISLTYSLARSYGFADKEARALTESTADFASSMGLTGDTLERIIRNFGQMKARGKITGTELRDLARGAFMPLDDIMTRIAKTMGITTNELSKLISKPGEGVSWKLFTDAFQQMVKEEPRFSGASERMARTFKAASDNVMDLATSFGGLNIAMPILDALGGRIADFMDQFIKSDETGQTFTELGQRFLDASIKVGDALSGIVSDVLGLLPSSQTLAEGLVNALESIAGWLTENKETVVNGVRQIFQGFKDFAESDAVKNILRIFESLRSQLFDIDPRTHKTGWEELGNAFFLLQVAIQPFLDFLGISKMELPTVAGLVDNLVKAITEISKWIYNNQEILKWLLALIISFIIIQFVTALFWQFIATLVSAVASIVTLSVAFAGMLAVIGFVIAIIGAVIVIFKVVQFQFELLRIAINAGINLILGYFQNMKNTINNIWTEIMNAARMGDWGGVGWAIVQGIARGIEANIYLVINAAYNAAMSAYNAAMRALRARSPSQLFADVGENIMAGMAEGIANSTGLAVSAMQNAISAVSMPAITMQTSQMAPSSISSTFQQNNQYNLQINSSANTEPVIADFEMLKSLAG